MHGMEVSVLRGSNGIIEKPGLLSNHIHSATSIPELILAEQESHKCKHFTIRGFVSEVRQRDAKFCWPFTSDEHINQLPPLHVKKFRQWGCQSCLHETTSKISVANGSYSNQNSGVKNKSPSLLGDATRASNLKVTKSLGRFLQQYEENNLQGTVAQEDNSNHIDNNGRCPLSCCRMKHDTSPTSDSTNGGIRVANIGYISAKENQNLRTKSIDVAAAEQAHQTVENGEGSITVTANSSDRSLLSKDTPKSLSSKRERTDLVHRNGGERGKSEQDLKSMSFSIAASDIEHDQTQGPGKIGKMKASDSHLPERMPLGVDATIPNNIVIPATVTHVSRYTSKDLVECIDVASDTSSPLIGNLLSCEDDARNPGMPMEKSCTRKFRKMRTLDDIMKGLKVQNYDLNCISSENVCPTGSDNIEMPAASKQRHEHPNPGNHLIQNAEATEIKTKNQTETIPIDGEGTCLSYWLKKVPKKASLRKGLGKSRHTSTASNPSEYATAEGLDLNIPISGLGDNNHEMIGEKKRNMIHEVEVFNSPFAPQAGSSAQTDNSISENLQTNNSHSKSVDSILSEKEMCCELESHDNTHREAPKSKMKNKRALVEDGRFSQHWSEDSLDMQKQPVKVKKKQKSMRMSEREAVDDIPMDIVELLAMKQHERHIMSTNHDSANMIKPLMMVGSTKNSSGWVDTEWPCRSKGSMEATRYISQEDPFNVIGNSSWTSAKNNGDTEYRSGNYHTYDRDKQCHQFDLNKEAPGSASSGVLAPSSYTGLSMSGAQLSIIDSNRNYSPRNFPTNGTTDNTISPQMMFSNVHDTPFGLLNGYATQNYAQKVCSNLHSNVMYPGQNQKAVAHDVGYQYGSKDKARSSNSGGTVSANSFAESVNGYYSNMTGAVDLKNNETISASNLLRLIQQSASSGEPCHTSLQYDNMGHIHAFNVDGRDLHRSAIGFEGPKVYSGACGNHELDKPAQNVCKPVRPLPRFGILGPLLHGEITKASDSSTLGFGAGNPSELAFHKSSFAAGHVNELNAHETILKGKTEASTNAHVLKDMNIQPSSSGYGSSERISSSVISPRCSVGKDNIGQVVTGSRDGAFQPVRSTCKMKKCVVNRNPADFAMPDEDSEYMIGYQEKRTEGALLSESQTPQSHLHGQKAQKMRKLNDLNHSGTRNKPPLSRLSCSEKAK